MRRGRVHGDLAREHDLLEVAGADPLDRARHGGLVVLGRRDRRDLEAARRGRVEHRQRRGVERRRALLEPRHDLLGHVVGRDRRGEREADVGARPRQRDLRDHEVAGGEAVPVAGGPALGGEREAADRHEPGAGRPVGGVGLGRARQLAPRRGRVGEAPRPAGADRARAAERAQGGAAAVRLLEAEPRLAVAARRERDGARVDVRGAPGRSARQHLAPAPPRADRGALAAREQLGPVGGRERERRAYGRRADGHAPQPNGASTPTLRWVPADLDRRGLAVVASGHAMADCCQGAVPALLPFLIAANGWSYATASSLVLASTVASSLVQPAFGAFADRRALAWLMPAGVLLGSVCVGLAAIAPSFPLAFAPRSCCPGSGSRRSTRRARATRTTCRASGGRPG